MTPPPRTPHQRKQDALNRLERDTDAWVATADAASGTAGRGRRTGYEPDQPRQLWLRADPMVARPRAARGGRREVVLAGHDAARRAPAHRRGGRTVGGWSALLHERRQHAQEPEPGREPDLRGRVGAPRPRSRYRGHGRQGDRRGDPSAPRRALRRAGLAGDGRRRRHHRAVQRAERGAAAVGPLRGHAGDGVRRGHSRAVRGHALAVRLSVRDQRPHGCALPSCSARRGAATSSARRWTMPSGYGATRFRMRCVAPAAMNERSVARTASRSAGSTRTWTERSMVAGSRPMAAQCPSRIAFMRSNSSTEPPAKFQIAAWRATTRNVHCSPLPPTTKGGWGFWTGLGSHVAAARW